jgi:hypothetical protein
MVIRKVKLLGHCEYTFLRFVTARKRISFRVDSDQGESCFMLTQHRGRITVGRAGPNYVSTVHSQTGGKFSLRKPVDPILPIKPCLAALYIEKLYKESPERLTWSQINKKKLNSYF